MTKKTSLDILVDFCDNPDLVDSASHELKRLRSSEQQNAVLLEALKEAEKTLKGLALHQSIAQSDYDYKRQFDARDAALYKSRAAIASYEKVKP